MPNTASAIRESITCICTKNGTVNETDEIASLFKCMGETVVIDENLMEAATILGACGIAYVLRFIRAMIQGGIQIGFDAKTATLITTQTVKGAAELLLKNNSHPEQEIDKVTTPKGTSRIQLCINSRNCKIFSKNREELASDNSFNWLCSTRRGNFCLINFIFV